MAIHLEKTDDGFRLLDNREFLLDTTGGYTRWTSENATEFVSLLNDFYTDVGFADFFHSNKDYFEDLSARFMDDVFNSVNLEWFRQHGINPGNMRVVISPASSRNGYGSWIYGESPGDMVVYAALPGSTNYSAHLGFIIHEFAHAIANPLAEKWYAENNEFRRWSDDSVNLERLPEYPAGLIMAIEYLTRAYTILYLMDNGEINLFRLLLAEMGKGFPYIQNVFALITDHELIVFDMDIGAILGVDDFTLGVERSRSISGRVIRWCFIDLLGHELSLDGFMHTDVGNIFGSQTGDAMHVTIGASEFLYIDLGSAQQYGWSSQHRLYCVYPLN
jgi:hypothetical protein